MRNIATGRAGAVRYPHDLRAPGTPCRGRGVSLPRDRQPQLQVEPAFNTNRGAPGAEEVSGRLCEAFLRPSTSAQIPARSIIPARARIASTCSAPRYRRVLARAGGSWPATRSPATHRCPHRTYGQVGMAGGIDEAARARMHALLAERRATCRDCSGTGPAPATASRAPLSGEAGTWSIPPCAMNREITADAAQPDPEGEGTGRRARTRCAAPCAPRPR